VGRWGRRRDTFLRKEMKVHVDSSFGYNLGSARIRRKNREGTGVCDIIRGAACMVELSFSLTLLRTHRLGCEAAAMPASSFAKEGEVKMQEEVEEEDQEENRKGTGEESDVDSDVSELSDIDV